MIRGQFRALRAPDRPGVATGVLWIRDCEIAHDGAKVTFHLVGNGWQWARQTKHKAGGTFDIAQYVRFSVDTKIRGALDIAYDRNRHVVSLWFSPDAVADVGFEPIGDIDVDRKGMWSSIVGGLGSVFADSPEQIAEHEATAQGTGEFQKQLADGLAVTIDLCTGLSRFNLGREPKGHMQPADVGETKRVPVELERGGMMIAGPQLAPNGMTVHAETTRGAVRMSLVCADYAHNLATGFVAGTTPGPVPTLATADVRGSAKLHVGPQKCPVMVVTTTLDNAPASYRWLRPASEIARSTGGPIVHCPGRPTTARK